MFVGPYKQLTPEFRSELSKVISRYEKKQAALMPVLHEIQKQFGFISPALQNEVAHLLSVPLVKVREVVSFYGMFHEKPIGRYQIKVCETLSCKLLGVGNLLGYLQKKLRIDVGETTPDGKFTLSVAQCLGACEMAPVMQINAELHGSLTTEKIDGILASLT